MQTKEWIWMDRSSWGEGPWQEEVDKIQWPDPETGYPCLAVRNKLGNWCGYVGIGQDHPAYGKDYEEVDVRVHGGLTYSAHCDEYREHGICHIPDPGEPDDTYWLGFDCAHSDDLSPGLHEYYQWDWGKYRTLAYVREQCQYLAWQLKAMEVSNETLS
jgi:hypothetical protein